MTGAVQRQRGVTRVGRRVRLAALLVPRVIALDAVESETEQIPPSAG